MTEGLRIALVHLRQSGTGGTERYLNQMARYLCERGHEVTIVCRSHEAAPHTDARFVTLRSPVIGATWRMWSFARAVEQHVVAAGYDVVFGLGKAWSHDIIRLGGGCHATYLELAHDHTRSSWERASGRGQLKQRVALTIEDRALRRGAYRRVIVNSEMVKRDAVARHGIPPELVHVIYNGVDLERFQRRRHRQAARVLRLQCGFAESDVVVLFLGTGYGRKGLQRLLHAFALVAPSQPRLRLLVVGYDSEQRAYHHQAAALGLARVARFLGGRRDAEVCYAASDLYALPTYYDPFANSTLEALASGLPVITTATNGGAEVLNLSAGSIVDESTGSLVAELMRWGDRDRIEQARPSARVIAERYPQNLTTELSTLVLEAVAMEKRIDGQRRRNHRVEVRDSGAS